MVAQAIPKKTYVTPEEYLAREREASFRSEYLDGEIYAMAGASPAHETIVFNVSGEMQPQLKGRPCQGFGSNMKVRTNLEDLFSYPDVSIVCGEPRFHDRHRDVLLNPKVIIEVLSESTEAYDRGEKFARYQSVESLTDYVLISQDKPRIEHFARQPDNRWILTTVADMAGELYLASIDCTLCLADVYDRVEFPPKAETKGAAES